MKMFSSSSVVLVSLCLLLCLPACLSSDETVTVNPGEDATLPCRSPKDAEITVIKWSKPDLESKLYVFYYRNDHPIEEHQHLSYRGRVELKDPEMKDGDVSVVLKNVNTNDAGTYECYVVNGEGQDRTEQSSHITLKVQVTITAEPGQSVSLPCRAPSNTDIIDVEWTRPGLEPGYVFRYQGGKHDPYNQHPSYENRVELKDREMKDGDVSIILKEVTRDDSGTYECHVLLSKTNRRKRSSLKSVPISIVHLEVHQSGGTGGRGGDKDLQIGLGVGLPLLVVVVGFVVGFIIYKRKSQRSDRAAYTAAGTGQPAD